MKLFLCILGIFLISCNKNIETHDAAYLQKLFSSYEKAEMENDMSETLKILDVCIAEANLQKNIDQEDYARRQKLACYYNYGEYETLVAEVSIQADFFRQHKRWNSYYWTLQKEIEVLSMQNRFESALRKAQNLYEEAQKAQNQEGIGIASYCIGYIYHFTGRDEEAEIYLRKALETLKKTNNKPALSNCYDKLCETLSTLKKCDAAISTAKQYELLISELEKTARDNNTDINYYGLRHMCYYNYAYAYYGLKNADKVEYYYKIMCENQGTSVGFISITQIVKRMLARLKGEIPYFMASTDSLMNEFKNTENLPFSIELLEEKAEVLMDIHQFENAANTYKEIISMKNSLSKQNMAAQLDDLRSIYELDRLTAEKEKHRLYVIITLTGCFFLIIILIIYILYSRRLKEKNRNLFNRIQELARLEKEQQRIEREEISRLEKQAEACTAFPNETSVDSLREELLIKRLRVWLNTDNRFTQPDINRKQMADYLGTNEKYLADAIRNQCDRQTVSDFINMLRLSYARELLSGNPEMTIETVALEAGLNTRTTLFRLFRKYYGMSPSEFRAVLKQS